MQNWESLLSRQEAQAYPKFFKAASGGKPNIVTGQEAVRFFARSGIPNEILSDIWETADRDNLGYLTPETFSVALKLIACAQHGREVTEPILSTVVPLPQFEGFNPDGTESPEAQVITPDEREKYLGIFRVHQPVDGLLDGEKAKSIFLKSKLPPDVLGRIWDLANVRKSGNLNQTEFVIAMHYIAKVMDGTITTLPLQLPAKVYASASGSIQSSPILRRTSMSPSAMISRQVTGSSPTMLAGRQRAESLDSLGSMAFTSTTSKWEIKPQERAQYDTFFDRLDTRRTGFIQGNEAVEFFKNSRLPEQELARIWDLADTEQRGRLSRDEFAVAMHLIQKRIAGEALPQALPKSLVPPVPATFSTTNTPTYQPQAVVASPQSIGQPVPPGEDSDLLGDFGNNEQLTEETNQVNQLQYQLSTLNGQISNVQAQKASVQQSREQLLKEKENLQLQLGQIQKVQQAENKRLAEIRELVTSEEPGWVQARLEYQEAEQQLLELKREIEQERTVLENGRVENESLRHRVHQVQEETAHLRQQLERLRADVGHQQQKPSFDDIFGTLIQTESSNKQKKATPPPPPPQRRHNAQSYQQPLANVTNTTTTKKSRAPPPPPPAAANKEGNDIQEKLKDPATFVDAQAQNVGATMHREDDKEQPLSDLKREGAPKESMLLGDVEAPLQKETENKAVPPGQNVNEETAETGTGTQPNKDDYDEAFKSTEPFAAAKEDLPKNTDTSSDEETETTNDDEEEDEEDKKPLSQLAEPEKQVSPQIQTVEEIATKDQVEKEESKKAEEEEAQGSGYSPAVSAAIAAAIAASTIGPIASAMASPQAIETGSREEKGQESSDRDTKERKAENEEDHEKDQPEGTLQADTTEKDNTKETGERRAEEIVETEDTAKELKGPDNVLSTSKIATPKEITGEQSSDALVTKEEKNEEKDTTKDSSGYSTDENQRSKEQDAKASSPKDLETSTDRKQDHQEEEQRQQQQQQQEESEDIPSADGTVTKEDKAARMNPETESRESEKAKESPPSLVSQKQSTQDSEKSTADDDFDAVFMERPGDKEKASSEEGTGEGESFEMVSSFNSAEAKDSSKNPFDSFFEDQDDDFDSAFAGPLADAKVVHSTNDPNLMDFDDAFGIDQEQLDKGKKLSWATNFGGFQFADLSDKEDKKKQSDDWDPFLGSSSNNTHGAAATATEHVDVGFDDAFNVSEKEETDMSKGTVDSSNLGQLVSMGFDRAAAKEALDRYDQDLTKATNFLLDSEK